MSCNHLKDIPRRCAPIITTTISPLSSPKDKKTTSQNPTSSFNHRNTLPDPASANPDPLSLSCPVPSCPLVFSGKTPHGYLWRHLRHPGIYKRTGEEKDAWRYLHEIEYERLAATGVTPAQRKREGNRARARKVREQKVLKAARFKLHARRMGFREKELAAQKVAIREGMHADKQRGDSIGHDAWVLLDLWTSL